MELSRKRVNVENKMLKPVLIMLNTNLTMLDYDLTMLNGYKMMLMFELAMLNVDLIRAWAIKLQARVNY